MEAFVSVFLLALDCRRVERIIETNRLPLMQRDKRAPEYKNADRETNQRPEGLTVVPAARARQAVTGHNVRYVLVFGLGVLIIAFVAIYLIYFK